ncbi:cytochrome P450, partial [Mycena olivaceomarginata]
MDYFQHLTHIELGAAVTVASLVPIVLAIKFLFRSKGPIPPGPPGLPFLGNIFQLPAKGQYLKFTEWKEKYGPIFSLNLMGQLVVVLNTHQVAADLLVARGAETTSFGKPKSKLMRWWVAQRVPTFADQANLPYIRALVKETLRWRAPGPLGVPRRANKDDFYEGYFIPKGTVVMYNACFGFGRRICVGLSVANQSLFIDMAYLVWALNIRKAKDSDGNPITPSRTDEIEDGLVVRPVPFTCNITSHGENTVLMLLLIEPSSFRDVSIKNPARISIPVTFLGLNAKSSPLRSPLSRGPGADANNPRKTLRDRFGAFKKIFNQCLVPPS